MMDSTVFRTLRQDLSTTPTMWRGHWGHAVASEHQPTAAELATQLPWSNSQLSRPVSLMALMTTIGATTFAYNVISDAQLRGSQLPDTARAWSNSVAPVTHPTMVSTAVREFKLAKPDADLDALRRLYDLAHLYFGNVPGLSARYTFHIDHDTQEPLLFLSLLTQGLEVEEIVQRELAMFSVIDAEPTLKAATDYHIVTAA